MDNREFVLSLLTPRPGKVADRKVWSVELLGVWIPFFTATNTAGVSAIPAEALGAPLRLQKEQDGTPKFSKSGRPVLKVVREISDQVRIMRENYDFALQAYTDTVRKAKPAEYQAQVEANHNAGEPIAQKDITALKDYLKLMAEARAEAVVAEAEAVVAKAPKGKKRAKAVVEAPVEPAAEAEKELVAA